MTKKVLAIIIGVSIIFTAGYALADYTSGTADYSVTLTAGCLIDTSAMTTDFGSYFIGEANIVNTPAGSVTITCSDTTNYSWGVNQGLNPVGAQGIRLHDGFGNYITYTLFENGNPLGDLGMNAIDSTYTEQYTTYNARPATGNGLPQTYNVNANVQINAASVAGTYTDTITVTVVWP